MFDYFGTRGTAEFVFDSIVCRDRGDGGGFGAGTDGYYACTREVK